MEREVLFHSKSRSNGLIYGLNRLIWKSFMLHTNTWYNIRGSLNKFPDFFRMCTFIDSTHMKLSKVISSGCNSLVVPFQQLLEGYTEVLLCERVNDLRHSLFHLLNCLITNCVPRSTFSRFCWSSNNKLCTQKHWYEFKSWTRLIAFHIALIPLGKVWIQ